MRNRKIKATLSPGGLDELIDALDQYPAWLERKAEELAKRLADMGALYAEFNYSGALYSGNTDCRIEVNQTGECTYTVTANGESVLFIEFGAGYLHGYGHPEPGEFGPGTYPGKGHWNDPKGWWYETDDPSKASKTSKKTGKSYVHSYGNPPSAFMYNAVKDLKQELKSVVEEVFAE